MAKRSSGSRRVKQIVLAPGAKVWVGLDVHKETVHMGVCVQGKIIAVWVSPHKKEVVLATLERWRGRVGKVVYEAGPTGFGLARFLNQAGFATQVVAPGKIPQVANPGNKSDRLDCRKLAYYAYKGLLRPIAIPTEQQEADRQVIRLREQLTGKVRRVKQQIKSFLLQHGIAEPEGLTHWSARGVEALKALPVGPELALTLEVMVDELKHLEGLRRRVQGGIAGLSREDRYRDPEKRLRTHPGVGRLTAMEFLTEVYQPGRFGRTQEVTSYVGLAPRVRQSGQTRREGPLVKAGREKLRSLLVEGSWRWVRDDRGAGATFQRLVHNTGSKQKAIVAMARRMAVNLWCMLQRAETYRASVR